MSARSGFSVSSRVRLVYYGTGGLVTELLAGGGAAGWRQAAGWLDRASKSGGAGSQAAR